MFSFQIIFLKKKKKGKVNVAMVLFFFVGVFEKLVAIGLWLYRKKLGCDRF